MIWCQRLLVVNSLLLTAYAAWQAAWYWGGGLLVFTLMLLAGLSVPGCRVMAIALARICGMISVFALILVIGAGGAVIGQGSGFGFFAANFGLAILLLAQSVLGLSGLFWKK